MPTNKNKSSSKKSVSKATQEVARQATKSMVIRTAIPQWYQLDPDQVQNAAGGFSWQISDQEQVIRYLIIGSEGGNYYQTPEQVSARCAYVFSE